MGGIYGLLFHYLNRPDQIKLRPNPAKIIIIPKNCSPVRRSTPPINIAAAGPVPALKLGIINATPPLF